MKIFPIAKKFVSHLAIGLGSVIFLGVIFILYSLGGFSANKAQKEFQPFAKTLGTLGAKKLCDNGDNGKGIDNNTPWYQAYYSVSNPTDLQSQLTSTAAQAGYDLVPDTHTISQEKGIPGDTNSTYLIAHNGGKMLAVRIAHSGDKVALYCGTVKNYGKEVSPVGNQAILDMTVDLPAN